MDALKEIKSLDRDDVLAALGLQARRGPAEQLGPVLGVFGAGLLIGAGLGLLLAPKPGHKLRAQLGKGVSNARDRALEAIEDVRN